MAAISGMLGGLLFVLLLAYFVTKWDLLAHLYDVRVTDELIEFVLFQRWVVYRLPFSNILQVIVGFGGLRCIAATNFRNRFSLGGTLLIIKKTGFFTRKILISPLQPALFAEHLMRSGVSVLGAEKYRK